MAELPPLEDQSSPDTWRSSGMIQELTPLALPAASGKASAPAGEVLDLATLPYTDNPVDAGEEDAVLVDDMGNIIPNESPAAPSHSEIADDPLVHDFEVAREVIGAQDATTAREQYEKAKQIRALEREILGRAGISVDDASNIAIHGGNIGVESVHLDAVEVLKGNDGVQRLIVLASEGRTSWVVPLADLQLWHKPRDVVPPIDTSVATSSSVSGRVDKAKEASQSVEVGDSSSTETTTPAADTKAASPDSPKPPEPLGTTKERLQDVEDLWRGTKNLLASDPGSPEAQAFQLEFGEFPDANMNPDTGYVNGVQYGGDDLMNKLNGLLLARKSRLANEAQGKSVPGLESHPIHRRVTKGLGRAALATTGTAWNITKAGGRVAKRVQGLAGTAATGTKDRTRAGLGWARQRGGQVTQGARGLANGVVHQTAATYRALAEEGRERDAQLRETRRELREIRRARAERHKAEVAAATLNRRQRVLGRFAIGLGRITPEEMADIDRRR